MGLSAFLCLCLPSCAAPDAQENAQVDVIDNDNAAVALPQIASNPSMRARVTAITPQVPVQILWRYGGESLGGEVKRGVLSNSVSRGEWTPWTPLATITKSTVFLTITTPYAPPKQGRLPKMPAATGVEMEFEFASGGKVIKTIKASGPNGGTVGFVLPKPILEGLQDEKSLARLASLQDYAAGRTQFLESLPWAGSPLPKNISIVTDLGGYGEEIGYMRRYSDPSIVEAELRSLRQLGVNGLRAMPGYMRAEMEKPDGHEDFRRILINSAARFPIPARPKDYQLPEGAPCPYSTVDEETAHTAVVTALENSLKLQVHEVWGLTIDEIGSVFSGAPGGKSHLATCPGCAAAYRAWLQKKGRVPLEFGQRDWSSVWPVNLWNKDKNAPRPNLDDPAVALNAYYTKAFDNYCTAKLFAPLRKTFDEANGRKKAAIEAGRLDSAEAKQPWLYSYALRGNNFLMGGFALDFFEFYRYADNAFVYETSNRDPRIWGWDSYLCDVGRMITAEQGQKFGIYVKPHRGAPLQRALSAFSRGADMLYWYTYGPDYFKGDSFSGSTAALEATSKAAHLIGDIDHELHDVQWAAPAEVAIVKPFSLEAWLTDTAAIASWEDTKWTYSALAHAHVPVDPIDEEMILKNDLSRYKVIYLPSSNLRKDAAMKLAAWVQAGGTLVTNAGGLARDEANQPLVSLAPALGLAHRREPEMWFGVKAYGAASIQAYPDPKAASAPPPAGATVTASNVFASAPLPLAMGREVLQPAPDAEILARYADGGVASIRHTYGKGQVYVNGFFPGLEYSIPIRNSAYDMDKDLNPATRSFIEAPLQSAGVRPVVDAAAPTVEGILLKSKASGARAVTLMNWGYRVDPAATPARSLTVQKNLKVSIRGAGPVKEVRSAWLDRALPMETKGDLLTVTLPELEEGDVLLLK